MTIDEAIERLVDLKAKGYQHLLLGIWCAEFFGLPDDAAWGAICDKVDDGVPFSHTWDNIFEELSSAVDEAKEEEESNDD